MSQPETQRHYSAGGIVALIVLGLLVLIPSGLCTAAFGGMAIYGMITNPRNPRATLDILPMVFSVGGPFIVGGGAMLVIGIRRARANARNRKSGRE